MLRITLLTAVSVLAVSAAHAETFAVLSSDNNSQSRLQAAMSSIKSWFGADSAIQVQPIDTASGDDMLQAPTPVVGDAANAAAAAAIEPAAGDDDMIQVPPPYIGADALANNDGAADANAITPAAGETPDAAAAVTGATAPAANTSMSTPGKPASPTTCADPVEGAACEVPAAEGTAPVDTTLPRGPETVPAEQPASPAQPLPTTQPAAGGEMPAPATAPAKQ